MSFKSQSQSEFLMDTSFLFHDQKDTTKISWISNRSPNRAAMLSAILPGLGQAYNKQLWKIPIIYTCALALAHTVNYNNDYYHAFRNALLAERDRNPLTINQFNQVIENRFTENALKRNMDRFRRNRDYVSIFVALLYLLNIAEAHIAAHLQEFEVNQSISVYLLPSIETTPSFFKSPGISLKIRF